MPYEFRNLYPQFTQHLSEWTKESSLYRNQAVYSRTGAWQGLYTPLTLEAGTYTVSFFFKTLVARVISISLAAYGESTEGIVPYGTGPVNAQGSNEWQRLSCTFTISERRNLNPRIENRTTESTKLYVSAPQLEVGSEMTLFEGYHSTWYIDDSGELTHTSFPEVPERAFQEPLPKSVWRTDNQYENGYPFNMLMPEIPDVGAFANAVNLKQINIPPSVKYIGSEAFKNTKLKNVRIASDCTYFDTSFPDGCTINFY